jgi:hypothetical protein
MKHVERGSRGRTFAIVGTFEVEKATALAKLPSANKAAALPKRRLLHFRFKSTEDFDWRRP